MDVRVDAQVDIRTVTSGSDPRITCNADMRRTSEAEPDG